MNSVDANYGMCWSIFCSYVLISEVAYSDGYEVSTVFHQGALLT